MSEGIDRRRRARLACLLSVQYSASGLWHPASALDLTEGGCRLRIGEDLASGTPLRVRFDAPLRDGATSPSFEVAAQVAWCRREGLSRQAGVAFSEAPPGLLELLRAVRPW